MKRAVRFIVKMRGQLAVGLDYEDEDGERHEVPFAVSAVHGNFSNNRRQFTTLEIFAPVTSEEQA